MVNLDETNLIKNSIYYEAIRKHKTRKSKIAK